MKINTNIILGIIIGILLLFIFTKNSCDSATNKPDVVKTTTTKVDVEVPKKTGSFNSVKPEPIIDTVYVDSIIYVPVKTEPNKELIEKYKKEVDSLKRLTMYEQAITKNSYLHKFDNEDISLDIYTVTTGTLDSLAIPRYEIKPQTIQVTETTKYIRDDRYHLYIGAKLGIPTMIDVPFRAEVSALLEKDIMKYSLSIDTQKTVSTGLYIRVF